jgi:hypothetical protein
MRRIIYALDIHCCRLQATHSNSKAGSKVRSRGFTGTVGTLVFILSFVLLAFNSSGQGLLCAESAPFCTGTIYTFPAGTTGYAEPGAYYGCLLTQPAPAWYHMLIANPGPIQIYMFSTPLVDIDFICWGPYTDPYSPCVAGLTSNKVVDCSYSPNPTEYCDIPNGQTGEYYILLITNYSQQPCDITFSQTGGTGSTDCTILPPPVGNNGPLCVGETLHLYADTIAGATYWWSGPNGFLSALQNPTIPNVTLANGGDYSCIITVGGQSSDPAVTSVLIYDKPQGTLLISDTIVCPNTPAFLRMSFVGFGPFSVDYNDGTNNFMATGLYGPIDTIFVSPSSPTTYTITEIHDSHCSRLIFGSSQFIDTYPATSGWMSGGSTICAGESVDLTFALTGTPPWTVTYTMNGSNPQTFIANSTPYILTVAPSVTTTYAFTNLQDIYCSGAVSGEALVTVNPKPQVNAGNDVSIPYGTSTTLTGVVTGGSGSYQYVWSPPEKLVNPTVLSPQTVNLSETTLFTLTATDNSGGCQTADQVLVTITGGPVGCSPTASPTHICLGESSQLQAMASGGSGNYTYAWSSNPSGFNSDLPDPTVSPTQTTSYNLIVDDGFNLINGSVTVTVNPLPVPNAGLDQTIPHGTNTQLNGSASGGSGLYHYHWEPADKVTNPNIPDPMTVNLYTTTLFTLTVTDNNTGCVNAGPDDVAIVISGDALSANPAANPEVICKGETVQLHALAGGGSGSYTYSWSSSPSGFMSVQASPTVSPLMTTIYTVVVNDGYNLATGSVAVTVHPVPLIHLGPPDTTVCVYDTITLDAGNPGALYQWSNGSTARTIKVGSTGIGFDSKSFSVNVTNEQGCFAQASITIYFDFSQCFGIGGPAGDGGFRIYPNPVNGILTIETPGNLKESKLVIMDVIGRVMLTRQIPASQQGQVIHINVAEFTEGIYFIRLRNQDFIRIQKVVVN